jgi:hypothetical protein
MAKELKSLSRADRTDEKGSRLQGRPSADELRELAAGADPSIPPAVMPRTGSEMINLRLSSSLVDQLDDAAEAEGTTRKVIITRALEKAGFRVPTPDLMDRTPVRRRDRRR